MLIWKSLAQRNEVEWKVESLLKVGGLLRKAIKADSIPDALM